MEECMTMNCGSVLSYTQSLDPGKCIVSLYCNTRNLKYDNE
jgi:hypothetical protein